jgi:predicted permease
MSHDLEQRGARLSMRRRVLSLWRNVVWRRHLENDLDQELRSLRALLVDENKNRGMSQSEAERAATLELGRVESVKEQVRDARTGAGFETLLRDLRHGLRSLRKTPGFTLTVILTLAVGIGANTAIFTLLDAVLFKPLPLPAAHELVTLYERTPRGVPDAAGGTGRYLRFSYPRYERLQQALGPHGSLAAVTRSSRFLLGLPGSATPVPTRAQLVSGNFFSTLGISPARGRFLAEPDVRAERAVAVISDGMWKRAFGSADSALGQTFDVNGALVTVVGIAPRSFAGIWTDVETDLWLPLTLQSALHYDNNSSSYNAGDRSKPWVSEDRIAWLNLVGRVPGSNLVRATFLLETANRQGVADLASSFTDRQGRDDMLAHTLAVEPFARGFSGLRAQFSQVLLTLAAIVAVVLLVTCANVANLMLARAAGHAHDAAIRVSLGATRGQLIRQYMTESVMLSTLGGGIGLLGGVWVSATVARLVLNTTRSLPAVFNPDVRVTLFASGITLVMSMLFGLAPALRAAKLGRDLPLTATQQRSATRSTMKGMRPLVAVQFALSVAVVFAAVLLGRTLMNFVRLDPGFTVDRLVSATVDVTANGHAPDAWPALRDRLVAVVRDVPGVTSASVSTCGLLDNCTHSTSFRIEDAQEAGAAQENWVGPAYFATTGIPLVAGREFDAHDVASGARVAIVTQSIARRYFPGQNPIGRRLGDSQLDTEIVGVVGDARVVTLHVPPPPMIYFPIGQRGSPQAATETLDVRVAGEPTEIAPRVRDALRQAEPGLVLEGVAAMSARVTRDVGRERIVAYLAAGFAAIALFLASLGLYGTLSYAVAGRTREIGVRMALGAQWREVVGLVVRDAATVVAAGVAVGAVAAFVTVRWLSALLFDVTASDPLTNMIVLAVLVVVTILAAYLPARRAALVDPVIALRSV